MDAGIIFDLDGVLVTTDDLHFRAWQRLAREENIPFSREINHRQRGIGRMESLDVLLEQAGRNYRDDEKRAMADRKNSYYCEMLKTLTPEDALPGARRLLRELRDRNIKVAVASASRNTPIIMRQVDLVGEVDAIADGNEVTRSKPDPAVFLLAAQKIERTPAHCVVVEDAPAGIEGGRRAGMAVFAIGPRSRHPDVFHIAETLVSVTVNDLLATLKPTPG
jgi:beta-phosphoglucomutase